MLMMAGCGGGGSGAGGIGGNNAPSAKHHLHGVMQGGQNPVSGSTVTLYAAGDSGYGSAASVLATTTTDSNGKWNIATFNCPVPIVLIDPMAGDVQAATTVCDTGSCVPGISPETYLVAVGGDSGSGGNNAIAMMAALGPCDEIQPSTNVVINELTTIAGQWALQQFANARGNDIGAPISNLGGLANAFATIANLVSINPSNLSVSGGPSNFLPTSAA